MGYKYDDDTGALPRNYIVVDCRGTDTSILRDRQNGVTAYQIRTGCVCFVA